VPTAPPTQLISSFIHLLRCAVFPTPPALTAPLAIPVIIIAMPPDRRLMTRPSSSSFSSFSWQRPSPGLCRLQSEPICLETDSATLAFEIAATAASFLATAASFLATAADCSGDIAVPVAVFIALPFASGRRSRCTGTARSCSRQYLQGHRARPNRYFVISALTLVGSEPTKPRLFPYPCTSLMLAAQSH